MHYFYAENDTIVKTKAIFFLLLLSGFSAFCQSLEGRWEGIMNDELLQINLVQNKNILCGYTYDYRLNDPKDHCKAYFTASFSDNINAWILNGNEFIENSGTHVFMQIRFREVKLNGKRVLHGIVLPQATADQAANLNYIEIFLEYKELPSDIRAQLRRRCFPTKADLRKVEKKKMAEEKKAERQEKDTMPAVPVQPELPPPPPTVSSEVQRVEEMNARKKSELSTIRVNTRTINIKVYDNGIVDDDTVTIFYNGKLLVDKRRLSATPIEFNLELEDRPGIQEIIMFAENLGSIPPNTALIVVMAGDKRYELYSSANMEENAVLRFEYKSAP